MRLDHNLKKYFKSLRKKQEHERNLGIVMEDPDCPLKLYRPYRNLTRFNQNQVVNRKFLTRRKFRKIITETRTVQREVRSRVVE